MRSWNFIYTTTHCLHNRQTKLLSCNLWHVPPNALAVFFAAMSFAKGREQPGWPIASCLQAWMLVYPKHTHTHTLLKFLAKRHIYTLQGHTNTQLVVMVIYFMWWIDIIIMGNLSCLFHFFKQSCDVQGKIYFVCTSLPNILAAAQVFFLNARLNGLINLASHKNLVVMEAFETVPESH